jgi:hypothetical protein
LAYAGEYACAPVPAVPEIPVSNVEKAAENYVTALGFHFDWATNIYTPRLEKLLRDDKRKAKGEAGCLDFVFWLNAQDWKITNLIITSSDDGQDRQTVITKFRNSGEPQEMHFDFRRIAGRWLLDDAHSLSAPPWTLSELLKCAP